MPSSAPAFLLLALVIVSLPLRAAPPPREPSLPLAQLAQSNFGNDAPWFLANIPFLEIDDPEIQQVYFYRWKLFRSHIRELGPQGTTVLEFLPDVPWARHPFTDLNDSASFHLLEGRWLRSPATANSLIDHLYTGGANDRHFSESIASATVATTLVTGDPAPALRHLDAMQHIYNLWDDHFDRDRNLYWIEPIADATEYTIASIDASGAGFTDHPSPDQTHNGFTGGFSFRPSINSYQFSNAQAIATLAILAHQPAVAGDFSARAERLRGAVLSQLWNPTLHHFTDRYQRSTPSVTAGSFIRGRELVGYTPWLYELPPHPAKVSRAPACPSTHSHRNTSANPPLACPSTQSERSPHPVPDDTSKPRDAAPIYTTAWSHLLNPAELAGPFGLRTVEPSYPRYGTQFRYDAATGLPECQWNGPSWPFQTSQTLTALANLLDDYDQTTITPASYRHLLRQYTHQHLLPATSSSGDPSLRTPDLQEDYNADTGLPIVGLPRSHHYAHSTYIDLILTGLLGIRPRADNVLELAPLLQPERASPQQDGASRNHRSDSVRSLRATRAVLRASGTIHESGMPESRGLTRGMRASSGVRESLAATPRTRRPLETIRQLHETPAAPDGPRTVDPDPPIRYFALKNLIYHGHTLGLFFDADGTRYRIGAGLSIFVDGRRTFGPGPLTHLTLRLPSRKLIPNRTQSLIPPPSTPAIDLAVNVGTPEGPIASASSGTSASEAIDGRLWFFPEIPDGWSPAPTADAGQSWFSVDLRQPRTLTSVTLSFLADPAQHLAAPPAVHLEYLSPSGWQPIPHQGSVLPIPNGETRILFPPLTTESLRAVLTNPAAPNTLRLLELKAFGPDPEQRSPHRSTSPLTPSPRPLPQSQ